MSAGDGALSSDIDAVCASDVVAVWTLLYIVPGVNSGSCCALLHPLCWQHLVWDFCFFIAYVSRARL